MEAFSQIALIFTIGLLGISILGITVFGLKNIFSQKHKLSAIVFFFIPVIIFAIAYLVTGFVGIAAINTLLAMIALMFLGILVSGSRSLISNF
ncbi:MAG: hypothetical protein LAT75_03435 [Candidatus Cyclonatronum sp.]|uniref:hypothetical protein n=1 Tax=Cyclonatronum sp. TaxID=3024185 RepID=UPI0025BE5548|nr:hypothetical protein [Cyclonatronum sp.]MCC5933210.1 hypothetical protein [Balneolales bacterium]MCH8485890.1 hypothetical protein [Cyclonatronum sp.]